jgi:hypothetical protein
MGEAIPVLQSHWKKFIVDMVSITRDLNVQSLTQAPVHNIFNVVPRQASVWIRGYAEGVQEAIRAPRPA